jgi:hypothetical protein
MPLACVAGRSRPRSRPPMPQAHLPQPCRLTVRPARKAGVYGRGRTAGGVRQGHGTRPSFFGEVGWFRAHPPRPGGAATPATARSLRPTGTAGGRRRHKASGRCEKACTAALPSPSARSVFAGPKRFASSPRPTHTWRCVGPRHRGRKRGRYGVEASRTSGGRETKPREAGALLRFGPSRRLGRGPSRRLGLRAPLATSSLSGAGGLGRS